MFNRLRRYIHNVLVGIDQTANIITGGKPDETISARSQRAADKGNRFGKFMVWWLGKIQKDHGKRAVEGDLKRAEEIERTEKDALKTP